MTCYLIRATTPHKARRIVPALQYFKATARTGSWGRYDAAGPFTDEATARFAASRLDGPYPDSRLEVVEQHDLDLDGYPMVVDEYIGAVRLTHCCAAATSVSDGPLYCKSCYEAVSWDYDGPARTPDNPTRAGLTGPITITLPPSTEQNA